MLDDKRNALVNQAAATFEQARVHGWLIFAYDEDERFTVTVSRTINASMLQVMSDWLAKEAAAFHQKEDDDGGDTQDRQ